MPLLLAGCSGVQPPEPAPSVVQTGTPRTGWTGEIRVRFSGCTSCADCRSAIRQISQSQSGSDQVAFHAGVARITYAGPAEIRAAEVANALSHPGVIKGEVDQVELSVEGRAEQGERGQEFVASATGQRWRISPGSVDLPFGKDVVIVALLEGWKASPTAQTLRILGVETSRTIP